MGLIRTAITLTNLFTKAHLETRALVDSGALYLCLPASLAQQLGFDLEETSHMAVTLADGTIKTVPRVAPVEVAFANRTYTTEALVLGDEALLGALVMEAMDLLIDPKGQRLIVNPEHPNAPVVSVKTGKR